MIKNKTFQLPRKLVISKLGFSRKREAPASRKLCIIQLENGASLGTAFSGIIYKGDLERFRVFAAAAPTAKCGCHWYSARIRNCRGRETRTPFFRSATPSPHSISLDFPASVSLFGPPCSYPLFATHPPSAPATTPTPLSERSAFRSNSISNQQPINWFEFSIQKERDRGATGTCMPMRRSCLSSSRSGSARTFFTHPVKLGN